MAFFPEKERKKEIKEKGISNMDEDIYYSVSRRVQAREGVVYGKREGEKGTPYVSGQLRVRGSSFWPDKEEPGVFQAPYTLIENNKGIIVIDKCMVKGT